MAFINITNGGRNISKMLRPAKCRCRLVCLQSWTESETTKRWLQFFGKFYKKHIMSKYRLSFRSPLPVRNELEMLEIANNVLVTCRKSCAELPWASRRNRSHVRGSRCSSGYDSFSRTTATCASASDFDHEYAWLKCCKQAKYSTKFRLALAWENLISAS